MNQEAAIGIDLGMAHISVSVIIDGRATPVPGASGDLRIPCFIGFTSNKFCVGLEALKQQNDNLRNTVFGAKRLVERDIISLPDASIARLPFRLVSENQLTKVEVRFGSHIRHFFLEEILSIFIFEAKEKAEAFLGQTVEHVVLGVPVHFTSNQRTAVMNAGEFIGFKKVSLANETSLLAIGAVPSMSETMNLLIFDFGCHSSCASVIQVSGKEFKVISSMGTSESGGKDIDNILVEHCLSGLDSKQKKRLQSDRRAMYQLEKACEAAKCTLSTSYECTIDVPSLVEGFNFSLDISRDTFEELCQDSFNTAIGVVKEAIERSSLLSHDISKVLLAGGSNNIPKMKALIESLAIGQAPIIFADLDAISRGAALLAQSICRPLGDFPNLKDITSFAIVIAESSQVTMAPRDSKLYRDYSFDPPTVEKLVAIPRGSPLPANRLFKYPLHSKDNKFYLPVYEGWDDQPIEETHGYTIKARDFTHLIRYELRVRYEVDTNGILKVHFGPHADYNLVVFSEEMVSSRCYEFWELAARIAIAQGHDNENYEARLNYVDLISQVFDVIESGPSEQYADALKDIYVVERTWLGRNKRAPKEMYLQREEFVKKYIRRAKESIPTPSPDC